MSKPKVRCPECGVWHEDIKNKWCDGCVMLYAHIHGWDRKKKDDLCKTCRFEKRRVGSAYCEDCANEYKKQNEQTRSE